MAGGGLYLIGLLRCCAAPCVSFGSRGLTKPRPPEKVGTPVRKAARVVRAWQGALAEQGEAGSGSGRRPLPCQCGSGAIWPGRAVCVCPTRAACRLDPVRCLARGLDAPNPHMGAGERASKASAAARQRPYFVHGQSRVGIVLRSS
jgi:hypothetical protein